MPARITPSVRLPHHKAAPPSTLRDHSRRVGAVDRRRGGAVSAGHHRRRGRAAVLHVTARLGLAARERLAERAAQLWRGRELEWARPAGPVSGATGGGGGGVRRPGPARRQRLGYYTAARRTGTQARVREDRSAQLGARRGRTRGPQETVNEGRHGISCNLT